MMPMFFIPIPFLFVLLMLLLAKAPRAGVWVVGGLISFAVFAFMILLPVGMHRGSMPNVMPDGGEIPFFAIGIPFLFVLLILLLHKSPKAGATVIVAVVAMSVLGAGLWLRRSHGHAMSQQATIRAPESIGPVNPFSPVALPAPTAPSVSSSPIWSEGVEHQFEADIYPSPLAAAEALGRRLAAPIHTVVGDPNAPIQIFLFQESNDRALVSALQRALQRELSDVQCFVEADLRNVNPGQVGLTLRGEARVQEERPRDQGTGLTIFERVMGGRITGTVFTQERLASAGADYIDKPWVDNFSAFVANKPDGHFLVARSREACTSENEARQQAIQDACNQLSGITGQRWTAVPGRSPLTVNPRDVQEGDFILDQFVQSFDGSAGRIWRQAILLDASAPKLAWLQSRKAAEMHGERITWARVIFSAFGVLVVIVIAYLFLNMATRGYYEWTLRIAGTVLAIAGIIAIFLVLR
ncbi:MAG TPA: hypothetical protein PLU87_13820 [Sedimentisphaerales bacterium]|nr:hypothetical protein [Sedimentisphaerales bacterium]HRS12129.1 hypothetical protein [Sedimentisphaerales bacterium]HRV48727.1 hypothetical protein [Sedimentisphaerales bacterium]